MRRKKPVRRRSLSARTKSGRKTGPAKTQARRKESIRKPQRRQPRRPTKADSGIHELLRALDHAHRQLELAAKDLQRRISDVQAAAVEAQRLKMVGALIEDNLLDHLSEARSVLEGPAGQQLPEELRVIEKLPHALMDWLEQQLDLRATHRVGESLQVPADGLVGFEVATVPDVGQRSLVALEVTAQGWKLKSVPVVKPKAKILE